MRVKLCEKYKIEREDICKKIIDILKLDANNSFLLSDLDEDTEKQTAILNMKEDIQKCFACSGVSKGRHTTKGDTKLFNVRELHLFSFKTPKFSANHIIICFWDSIAWVVMLKG